MTAQLWVAILVAAISSLGAMVVGLLAFLSSKKNSRAIQEIHLSINSRLDLLLSESMQRAHLEGVRQGENTLAEKSGQLQRSAGVDEGRLIERAEVKERKDER